MPWEDTEDFIRSGHRNPEEFESDGLRTITLSEEDGIKAVIGKPKGKKTTEVVSYLFSKEKGWTLEKAKEWFREHQEKAKESFSWAGSIKEVFGTSNLIRGKALHPLRTVHPEEWPQVREYLEEELEKSAHTLAGKPLILDHFQVLQGKVLGAEYEDGAIEYVAQLNDPGVMELIRNGAIKHCSVEFEWKSLEQVNGVAPRGINFTGLSLLRLFEPGDPLTTVEVWEGIVKRLKEAKEQATGEPHDFILYPVRDLSVFMPEHFQVSWIDQTQGIQALYARLIENPESVQPFALLFMKASGWTPDKITSWLADHPQYAKPSLAPQPVGVQVSPAPPTVGGIETLNEEELKKLVEAQVKAVLKEQEDEREKLRQAQKERAEKYGISPKEGGHLTKPSEYEDVPEDKFADPVNYRYPVTEKYVKGALTYFNQPDNRKAGGYTHEEAVKIMTTIVKAALNAGTEVSWQPEDPVYRDLPEDLKKKLTGYEKPSQTATEQQGSQEPEKDEHGCIVGKEHWDPDQEKCVPIATEQQGNQQPEKDEHGCVIGKEKWDPDQEKCVAITAEARIAFLETVLKLKEQQDELTVEEIKQKIIDLTKRQEELRNKLYPEAELSEEEKVAIQAEIDALYAELQGYEQALAAKIAGQAVPPGTPPAKPETAGEAIITPTAPSPTDLISRKVVLAMLEGIIPPPQIVFSHGQTGGFRRLVDHIKRVKREIEGEA